MFDIISGLFTGGASSAATGIFGVVSGLVGGVVTSITNYKMKKLQLEEKKADRVHEQEMMKLTTAQILAEADANVQIARETTRGKVEELEADAYKKSQESLQTPLFYQGYMKYLIKIAESGKWYSCLAGITVYLITIGFAFVDMLKHSARPILTYYTMGLATYITVIAYEITKRTGQTITGEQAFGILMLSINTVLYLSVTAFSWWFCSREISKFVATKLGWKETQ